MTISCWGFLPVTGLCHLGSVFTVLSYMVNFSFCVIQTSSDTNITSLQSIPPPPAPREGGCRVLLSVSSLHILWCQLYSCLLSVTPSPQNVPGVFSEGERVPCPSGVVRSMQRVRHGRGFPIYHRNMAFTAEEVCTFM